MSNLLLGKNNHPSDLMHTIALNLSISENCAKLKTADSAYKFQCPGNFSVLSCNH